MDAASQEAPPSRLPGIDSCLPQPWQQRVTLGSLTFASDFECGNMDRVEMLDFSQEGTVENEYVVTVAPDCAGTEDENNNKSWFYFSVEETKALDALNDEQPPEVGGCRKIQLAVRGLNNHVCLFRQGYRPWYQEPTKEWQRLPSTPEIGFSFHFDDEGNTGLTLRWAHSLSLGGGPTFFAFCIPFSYTRCQELVGLVAREFAAAEPMVQSKHTQRALQYLSTAIQEDWVPNAGNGVYFHRETLATSLDGRCVDLLTVTAAQEPDDDEVANHYEVPPPELEDTLSCNPAQRFACRPIAFISARVHPGETPAQFTFFGLLRFLISNDPRAKSLRANFVFKLVPMLNPDGVARGHFRTNSLGFDLNRCYASPQRSSHEGIWTVKQLLMNWAQAQRLLIYMDVHAHPSRQGCFLLMNRLEGIAHSWNMAFARLCKLNCPHFDLAQCDFDDLSSEAAEGRHGTGRAAIGLACGLRHAYTLECNFHTGKSAERVFPAGFLESSSDECPGIRHYRDKPVPYYPGSWAQVGEATLVSLLDLYGHNCCSRLPRSKYKSVVKILEASTQLSVRYGNRSNSKVVKKGETSTNYISDITDENLESSEEISARERSCGLDICCWQALDATSANAVDLNAGTMSLISDVSRPPNSSPVMRESTSPLISRFNSAGSGSPYSSSVGTAARARGHSVDIIKRVVSAPGGHSNHVAFPGASLPRGNSYRRAASLVHDSGAEAGLGIVGRQAMRSARHATTIRPRLGSELRRIG